MKNLTEGLVAPVARKVVFECPRHGRQKYDAYVPGEPYCPVCRSEARRSTELVEEHKADTRVAVKALYDLFGLREPESYGYSTFENYVPETDEEQECLRIVRRFADRFGMREEKRLKAQDKVPAEQGWQKINSKGLMLFGSTGNGKTHLALAAMLSIHEQGYRAFYAKTPDLLLRLSERNLDRVTAFRMLSQCPVMILDELGVSRGAAVSLQAERRDLYTILDARYTAGRPTVLISNADVDASIDYLGDRLSSRIVDMCLPLRFTGRDRRSTGRRVSAEADF